MALVLAGKITGCFGLQGYLALELVGTDRARAKKLRIVYLGGTEQEATEYLVDDVRVESKRVLIKCNSVDDRTAAEKLRGKMLFVAEEDVAPAGKDSYFIHDILGCEAWTTEGSRLGKVVDVLKLPAGHLWVIEGTEKLYRIPAAREFIRQVDLTARKIVVHLQEGLQEI